MLLLPKATKRKLEDFTLMSYLVMPLLFSMHFGFKLKFLTDWVYYYIYYPKKIILSCFFFKRRKRDAFNLLKGNNTLHLAYRTFSLKYKYLFILIFASSHYSSPKFTDIYWCEHFRHSLNLMIHHNATLGDVL